jgi:YesN/AraC family two-component response regulator
VDDEALIRKGLLARIQYFQFPDLDVVEAASGREAISLFGEMEIDLVIADICMPDMNGLELIRKAREIQKRSRFLLLSGFAEFAYAQEAIALGVRAYLNKPVSNEVLKKHIATLLQEARAEDRTAQEKDGGEFRKSEQAFDPEKELNILLSRGRELEELGLEPEGEGGSRLALLTEGSSLYLSILHAGRKRGEEPELSREQIDGIRYSLKGIFDDVACGCDKLIVNSYQSAKNMYALFWAKDDPRLRQKVEQVFLTLQQVFERHMNARLTMGVSRLGSEINPDRGNEAWMALQQRRAYGRSNIYFYEDIPAYEVQPLPEAEMELLRKHMLRGEIDGIRRQLEVLFSGKRVEASKAMYLHVMWVRVVSLMLGVYGNGMDSATMNHLLTHISRADNLSDRREIIQTLMNLAEICLQNKGSREMSGPQKIEYALQYIRDHYNEDIVINDLAARLYMSPSYFSSMFKREVRQSTMQYITGIRLERAREYLETTDQSVAAIAKNVGYEDSQYFFRVFKKVTGMTPLQYRQVARSGGE